MKYNEFIQIIEKSDSTDWINAEKGLLTCRDDLLVTIRENQAIKGNAFFDWTKGYEHPDAVSIDWELCYNGVCIERFETVQVDKGRMYIPLPDANMQISDRQRRIGYIINSANRTDFLRYLDMARITVREAYTQLDAGAIYTYSS